MKIKLFLSSSLLLLGVWLAAAYNHTVDLSSYRSTPAAKALHASADAVDAEAPKEEEVSLASQ
jgi:hypothetical protein